MRIPSGVTDQYIYFVAVDATDLKTRETGLSAFTVRRSRNGAASAAYTTPTVNETDSSNMPGVYELLLDEDMTIDSGDQSQEVCLHITCTGMAPVTRVFELYRPDVTAGETLAVSGGRGNADVVYWAAAAVAAVSVAGVPEVDVTHWLGTAGQGASGRPQVDVELWLGSAPNALVSGRVDVTVGAMQTAVIVAATFGAGAIDNAAIAADAIGSSELAASAATEIATAVSTAIGTGTAFTAIPWNAAWDAEVQSEVADGLAAYDPPTKGELDAAVAPLALEATLAVVDGIVDSILVDTGTTLDAKLDALDALIDLVKAKTDNLPTDPADQSLIIDATDAIITAIDAVPTNAELATALAAADDAVLAAISTLSGAVATVDTVVDALAVSLAVVDGLVDAMTVRVSDMWQLQGLDGSNPAVFTPAAFDVGTIHINVTGDGTATTTLTRTT